MKKGLWRKLTVVYALVAVLLAWPTTTGIFYHSSQAIWLGDSKYGDEFAQRHRREDLGVSMVLGFLYASIWPVGTPMAFAMTGFAENGVFAQSDVYLQDR